jgi:hypothetical protein
VLLRDARSLMNAAQYRRAVIDAATASDLAVLNCSTPSSRSRTPPTEHKSWPRI